MFFSKKVKIHKIFFFLFDPAILKFKINFATIRKNVIILTDIFDLKMRIEMCSTFHFFDRQFGEKHYPFSALE